MQIINNPINGNEDRTNLSEPIITLSEFYEAFNKGDIIKMTNNWLQNDEIAMDNPVGGIKRGWNEIKEVYEKIFNGPAKVYVEFYDYSIHQSNEIFYVVGRERGEFKIDNEVVKLAIRTSRIFKYVDNNWKQVHHHGSIDDPNLLSQYQNAVKKNK